MCGDPGDTASKVSCCVEPSKCFKMKFEIFEILMLSLICPKHSHLKRIWPEIENIANLKSAFFIIIMLLHKDLTHIHSQKKPMLHFCESFTLTKLCVHKLFLHESFNTKQSFYTHHCMSSHKLSWRRVQSSTIKCNYYSSKNHDTAGTFLLVSTKIDHNTLNKCLIYCRAIALDCITLYRCSAIAITSFHELEHQFGPCRW